MMLDAEIYVDRIADMRITNMNATMEAVRQSVIKNKGNDQEDLYLGTLELAQVQEEKQNRFCARFDIQMLRLLYS